MIDLWMLAIGLVLLSGAIGVLRVGAGPTAFDRMLASQLLGTSLVAALLLAAHVWRSPALVDVAMLLALLAAVTVIAMLKSALGRADR